MQEEAANGPKGNPAVPAEGLVENGEGSDVEVIDGLDGRTKGPPRQRSPGPGLWAGDAPCSELDL